MIHWLVQSTTAHPDLISGQASPGLLSAEEREHFNGFSVLKRRQDWLLGRWTTKLLLQEIIRQESGRSVALNNISILPGKDGAPRVTFTPPFDDLNKTFSVSISHSHGTSLCAAVSRPNWPLGADIEFVEPRSASFAADFFTAEEQAQVRDAAPEMKERLVTAVWSGKEAALKAIHQGLRSDTRVVSCNFRGLVESASMGSLSESKLMDSADWTGRDAGATRWRPFGIRWERKAGFEQHPQLNGWWMVSGQYVLTLATRETISNNR